MLKLCRVTKVRVLFLGLVSVFRFNLFKFLAAILEKGLLSNSQQLLFVFLFVFKVSFPEKCIYNSTPNSLPVWLAHWLITGHQTVRCESSHCTSHKPGVAWRSWNRLLYFISIPSLRLVREQSWGGNAIADLLHFHLFRTRKVPCVCRPGCLCLSKVSIPVHFPGNILSNHVFCVSVLHN